MSKPAASRGWVCAFCVVTVLAIALTLLAVSPAARQRAASTASAGPLASQPTTVSGAARGRIQSTYAALPLAFERNQGQTDAQVEYMARGNGYTLFLTANDAVFSLHSQSAASKASAVRRGALLHAANLGQHKAQKESTAVVRMQLVGGNSLAKVSASDELPGKSNYFLGNDPSKWRSNVPHYARVSYQNVYPGVNLAYHGAQRQTEFDFVVGPGANPAPIGFHFTGAQRVKTDDSGNLVISSTAGDVLLHKPVAYQEQNGVRQVVDARFTLKANNQVSFELGSYDRRRELVIDPAVTYSTYLGGSAEDDSYAIAFDSSGNAYVTGQTQSPNFPVVGGVAGSNAGGFDVFVTKVAANGSSLVYSTYVGGSLDEIGNAIAVVQSSGVAFVAGQTASTDFPHTSGAFQTALGAGAPDNAFVFELSANGGQLTYSTYLGGTGGDVAFGIALDSTPNVYLAGAASSTDFPTKNPLPGSPAGGFVAKLSPSGGGASDLVYFTYLGGGAGDSVNAIALDSSSNAYVTGQTFASGFHTTSGAYQTTCGSCSAELSNAFVTAISPTGNAYVYSTFLGGTNKDAGNGIAVDSTGAYVVGTAVSTDFPTTTGALQATSGGNTDAFVTKLKPDGSGLLYSTFLGGGEFDSGETIAVDATNIAYVTGQTQSSNFPTASPTQSALNGTSDAFVSEISSTGSQLVFSTYLGGSLDEDGFGGDYGGIAVDSAGANIYVTGNTDSTDFPTTGSAHQTVYAGGNADAFVVKYSQGPSFTVAGTTPTAVAPGTSATSTVTLTAYHGYTSPVNLTCAVTGGGSPPPACSATSFSTNPVTPTTAGAATTLTITTTGSSSAMSLSGRVFYAMWLPIAGMSVVGMGFSSSRSRRKKMLGFLMVAMVMAALFIMPACGGSSSSGGGGGGCSGCTPAGSYTVTITGTGTDANATTASTQVMLTVN